jgi:hypothetical protein
MGEIGPVQLMAFAFGPDAKFEGHILAELAKLEGQGTIRILDLLFVQKDADNQELVALDYQGEDLGGIIGALLGFEFDTDGEAPAEDAGDQHAFGMTKEQVEQMALSLDPGTAAGLLLIEHVWARDLKRAIRDAGGVPIGEGFLTPETMLSVAPELAGMAAAYDELEAEGAN